MRWRGDTLLHTPRAASVRTSCLGMQHIGYADAHRQDMMLWVVRDHGHIPGPSISQVTGCAFCEWTPVRLEPCALLRAGLEMTSYATDCLDKDPARRCFPGDSVSSPYQRHVVPPSPPRVDQGCGLLGYWQPGDWMGGGFFLWRERQ